MADQHRDMATPVVLQEDPITDETSVQHILQLLTAYLYQQAPLLNLHLCSVPEGGFLHENIPDRRRDGHRSNWLENDGSDGSHIRETSVKYCRDDEIQLERCIDWTRRLLGRDRGNKPAVHGCMLFTTCQYTDICEMEGT